MERTGDDALAEGPGVPGRVSIFTGQRGVGKTVMLNEASDRALHAGWRSLDLTATPGLLSRLDVELSRMLAEEEPARRRVTGVSVAAVEASPSRRAQRSPQTCGPS